MDDSKAGIFGIKDMIINNSDETTEYRSRKHENKKAVKWGQRKLALALIQFLTFHWNPKELPNPKLLYVGSAPGHGISYVKNLFPAVEFYLYDPRETQVTGSNVHVIRGLFTDEIANAWKDRCDVLLVSDVRSDINTGVDTKEKIEKIVMSDMKMQEKWFNIIKPVAAHLKFRLPYSGADVLNFTYLNGIVYKRVWGPQTTTEGGLVPTGGVIDWDIKLYEEQMFYQNTSRETTLYANLEGEYDNYDKLLNLGELLNDYDSSCEILIFKFYLDKVGENISTMSNIYKLSKELTNIIGSKRKIPLTLKILRKNPNMLRVDYRQKRNGDF